MTDRNRISFLATAAAALVLLAGSATAQAPDTGLQPLSPLEQPQAGALDLTMEQRHVVKEIIIKEMKAEPQPQAGNVPVKVGDTVPPGIPLQPVPVEVSAKIPQLKTHAYIVKDNKVVLIDPKNNKVAALVE